MKLFARKETLVGGIEWTHLVAVSGNPNESMPDDQGQFFICMCAGENTVELAGERPLLLFAIARAMTR